MYFKGYVALESDMVGWPSAAPISPYNTPPENARKPLARRAGTPYT